MKRICLLLFLFYTGLVFSQSNCGVLKYKEVYAHSDKIRKYDMFFSLKESLYAYDESSDEKISVTMSGFTLPDRILPVYNYKTGNAYIAFQSDISFQKVVAIDDFNIIWKIFDEEKTIGGYNCKKATTTFRNVNYVAWFTEDIPVPFGPWKLRGLNGLILEAYEENFKYHLAATQINLGGKCDEIEKVFTEKKLNNPLSWKEYVKLVKNEERDLQNMLNAKTDRDKGGISVEFSTFFRREIID